MRYGGRQWVTNEAKEDVQDSIELAVKADLERAIKAAGLRPIGEPELRWQEIWRLRMNDPAAGLPEALRDDDWELRAWVTVEDQ
jgi:hypothetical protein